MEDNPRFYIPVDDVIKEFLGHLDANPRTILSSRFGDGKSFFLQKFKDNEEVRARYEIITLYPVNYQVVDNKDVFDLIKMDLLFQLFCHGMISDDVVISKDVALSFFIQKNGISLAEELMQYFSLVGLESEECKTVLLAIKGLKLFENIKKQFGEFEKDYKDGKISKFIDSINNHFLYENDIVTEIIRNSIEDFRKKQSKKVVLVIEDMDRIDPAHLFRILNILSAHIDCSYRLSVAPQRLVGNKYNIDNVVLVIDYSNLKNIFHHFYGNNTAFDGYIGKFLSSTYFRFSLEAIKAQHYSNEINRITGVPVDVIKRNFDFKIFNDKTIRDAVNAFDISNQLVKKPVYVFRTGTVEIDTTILKMLSFMRRMNIDDSSIISFVISLQTTEKNFFIKYVAPYVFLMKMNNERQCPIILNSEGYTLVQTLDLDPNNGTCSANNGYYDMTKTPSDIPKLASFLLSFIRR